MGMATVDVTIRGAGIVGLSCAWEFLKRGATVQVIDPWGVAAGASGGIVGALAPHTPDRWNTKKAFQLKSLLSMQAYWDEIEAVGGLSSGYARVGRVQPLLDERAVMLARDRIADAAQNWGDVAEWRVVDAAMGWHVSSPTGLFLYDTLSARVHPAQACNALAAAIRARGAIVATAGSDQGAIVWATGVAGLTELSTQADRPVGSGVKGQAASFALDRRLSPQLYADGLHIVPHSDGTTAVGSTSEREYAHATTTDAQLDAVIDRARSLCPDLKTAKVVRRWANLRPRARSRAPLIDAWPDRNTQFVANGGFKIGFGMAPEMARHVANLVLECTYTAPDDFRLAASL
jgi:glycine oxidase